MNPKDSVGKLGPWQAIVFNQGDDTFAGKPPHIYGWHVQFSNWIGCQWYGTNPIIARMTRRPGGFTPVVEPLVSIAEKREKFDLSDPLTYSLWLDFINEFPQRKRAWKAFEKQHGPQSFLIYYPKPVQE
jgi:hypothetical protein